MSQDKPQQPNGREDEPRAPDVSQAEDRGAAPEDPAQRRNAEAPEHRPRSQRTDLLEGDPAGTAYSEEMGHTPTRL